MQQNRVIVVSFLLPVNRIKSSNMGEMSKLASILVSLEIILFYQLPLTASFACGAR